MDGDDHGRTTRAALVHVLSSRTGTLGITTGPALYWLLLLLLAPLSFMVAISFVEINESYEVIWQPTLANYETLFTGTRLTWFSIGGFQLQVTAFEKALLLSYFIATVTTVLCLLLAFPLAYLLARRDNTTFKVVIFLVLLPFFTMYLVRAYSWFLMFGSEGVINTTLRRLGIVDGSVGLFEYGVPAIIVGLTHAYFPYMLLSLYASLDGLDFSLVEAARDLGASRTETLADHIVPLTLPGIIGGSLFVFVPSVGAFITPRFLGLNKVQMIGQLIEDRIKYGYDIGYGSAASMFIVVSIVVAFALAFRYVSLDELGGA
jgi:spermidine/putrescine transport system permease protein